MVEYFFDTYALIEIVKGNPAYARYSEAKGHTAIFNLYELYAHILKGNGEQLAKQKFDIFKGMLIEIKQMHGDENIEKSFQKNIKNGQKNIKRKIGRKLV